MEYGQSFLLRLLSHNVESGINDFFRNGLFALFHNIVNKFRNYLVIVFSIRQHNSFYSTMTT